MVPNHCWFQGHQYECGLSLSCVFSGSKPLDLCNGGMVWSCCVPRGRESTFDDHHEESFGVVNDPRKIHISNSFHQLFLYFLYFPKAIPIILWKFSASMMISVLLIMTISLSMISLLRRIPFRQLGLRGLQGRFVTILQGLHTLQNTIKGNLQSEIPVGFGLIPQPLLLPYILLSFFTNARCLKIAEKVSFKIASEASNISQKWSILTSF